MSAVDVKQPSPTVTCWRVEMHGVAVVQETYGAMAKTEKIAFILEQVRLCLDRGDFIRYIHSLSAALTVTFLLWNLQAGCSTPFIPLAAWLGILWCMDPGLMSYVVEEEY